MISSGGLPMETQSARKPESGLPDPPKSEILQDCLLITALWIAVYVVLRPLQNTPFQDDWIYAWRVRWFLDHGQLRALEYSSNPNFVQVLWGALFCLPFGFSFTALRLSTGVLALAAICGQYLLLRELRVTRRDSWIGTAALALNPIFFMLAFTFMTETPFLCLMIWACYTMVRAVRTENTPLLIVSIVLACLSAGVRVIGIVFPVAASLTLLFHSGEWGRRRLRYAYPLFAPILLAAVLVVMYGGRIQRGIYPSQWRALPRETTLTLAYGGVCLGFWLLPLSLGLFRKRSLYLACALFVPIAALMAVKLIYRESATFPLLDDAFWTLREVGRTEREVPGYNWPVIPVLWKWAAIVLAAASLSGLLAAVWRRPRGHAEPFLIWLISGQLFLTALVWLIFDRYIFTVAPLAIALALSGRAIQSPSLAAAFVCLFGIASFVGVRDHLAYNAATWQGITELRQLGARDVEINAGYVANSWLQRTHPETAPLNANGRWRAPWYFPEDEDAFHFEVSNSPRPGTRVLQTIPHTRWFAPSGSIYLLERATAPRQD